MSMVDESEPTDYPGAFGYFIKYQALVLHYSEAAGAAAFFCTTNRGKLLQHKLRGTCTVQ